MIRAIAIDDELPALQLIEIFCKKTKIVVLEKSFNKPTDALKHINKYPVDLLFLDINMPSLSGIDLYKNTKQDTMVIFTTAYSEYAVDGFNMNAIDFLLKPFTYERFEQAVQKANEYMKFQKQKPAVPETAYIYVRADYRLIRLDLADIIFVEALDDYLKIHLAGHKPVVTRMTLKNITEKLPADQFIRVHRSYLVAFTKIKSIRGKMISLAEGEIPLSGSYEENFYKVFNKR